MELAATDQQRFCDAPSLLVLRRFPITWLRELCFGYYQQCVHLDIVDEGVASTGAAGAGAVGAVGGASAGAGAGVGMGMGFGGMGAYGGAEGDGDWVSHIACPGGFVLLTRDKVNCWGVH